MIERWKAGRKVPVIDKWPELFPGLRQFWEAFSELDSDRPPSMGGFTRIPTSAIIKYAEFWGFDKEQADDLFYFIREMDQEAKIHYEELSDKSAASKRDKMQAPGSVTF